MYTPRALLSGLLFVKICLFVLSLYTVGQLVTLPCEINFQSPSLQIRVRDGKVWPVYIHTVNRVMRFRNLVICHSNKMTLFCATSMALSLVLVEF